MELFRALAVLADGAGAAEARVAAALGISGPLDPSLYTDLFVFRLYPYASVYLGPEGMLGGDARDRIAGFWRVLGLDPPEEADHLTTLLALYAGLAEAAQGEADALRHGAIECARSALFWEHLASWLPVYLARVQALGSAGYREWAELLDAALRAEAARVDPPAALSRHLADAPELADPREVGGEAFLAGVLAPVRCGFILTRDDLARAAHDIGIGLRQGERRYALTAMLGQDQTATLHWLARTARASAAAHAALPAIWGHVRTFWHLRAQHAAELLTALACELAAAAAG